MKFTRVRPGVYTGTDGICVAHIRRMREGMIGCNEIMWVTKLNGIHITNADTLADAKKAASDEAAKFGQWR